MIDLILSQKEMSKRTERDDDEAEEAIIDILESLYDKVSVSTFDGEMRAEFAIASVLSNAQMQHAMFTYVEEECPMWCYVNEMNDDDNGDEPFDCNIWIQRALTHATLNPEAFRDIDKDWMRITEQAQNAKAIEAEVPYNSADDALFTTFWRSKCEISMVAGPIIPPRDEMIATFAHDACSDVFDRYSKVFGKSDEMRKALTAFESVCRNVAPGWQARVDESKQLLTQKLQGK